MVTELEHIKTINVANDQAISIDISKSYQGLYFESTDLDTGGSDWSGSAVIDYAGKTIYSCDYKVFTYLNNLFMGKPTWDASNKKYAFIIPFGFPKLLNCLNISEKRPLTIYHKAGNAVSGNLAIFGILGDKEANYIPRLSKFSETGSGRIRITPDLYNIAYILAIPRDASDTVMVTRDGDLVVHATGTQLERLTELVYKIESGTLDYFLVDFTHKGGIHEVVSRDTVFEIEHGASGTTTIYVFALEFDKEILSEAISEISMKMRKAQDIARKVNPDIVPLITTRPRTAL